jgi:iron-sulfur cluster repair protein YtfE (RIC family)
MSDVFTMLEHDHREVERMLAVLEKGEEGTEREQTVERLRAALTLHMDFEEDELYPLLAELDADKAQEANIEHRLAREGVAKMAELVTVPGFGAALEMVKAGIAHHVEEEERELFPKLRKSYDDPTIKDLTLALRRRKREAGLLAAELDEATKDELMEMARDAGIEGRSSMTKDQLKQALVDA